ncbi:ribokinase [Rhinocladiella mackenziei CBS 650.93]|uniref:Ribokinase n=1 Tax=Rhinocladiella mackenziei CBS 650.93 TaxID=1442369 RepID=A0A0D2G340_9EURO|nr:ribokinase [Rhinocladiella mackenziei CBS 650.93]KIX08957.1 ribokinase [Rhinocladiella mackenziei CBS 650.93]
MVSKPVIRVIGSLNIDFVTRTPRVPGPGETLTATSMTVHAGGKGANQAVACGKAAFTSQAEQDVIVDMIGAVGAGDPYYASLLKPTLEKSGVSTTYVEEIKGIQTGTATIIVDSGSDGQNRILFVPGANARVTDVTKVIASATRDSVPDVVVMQGEIPRPTVLGLLGAFNSTEYKTCVIFNPAPVFPEGIPIEALKGLAALVVNETECLLLFRAIEEFKCIEVPSSEADMTESHLARLTKHLHDRAGISVVAVTLGSRGVYYSADIRPGTPSQDFIPAVKIQNVVDTTAAGDTFVGYFSTALARHLAAKQALDGFDVRTAVSKANQAAAKCIQRSGAMESIPFGYE